MSLNNGYNDEEQKEPRKVRGKTMQNEKEDSYLHRFLLKIHDPGYKGEDQNQIKYNIWPVRVLVLFFLIVNFHMIKKRQFINLDVINLLAEFFYFIYVGLTLIFTKKRFTPEIQFLKLIVDLFFITVFQSLSLIQYDTHSWIYILFLIPIIFCSFRFNEIFTLIFATFVSAIYFFSNYFILNLGETFGNFFESVSMLLPVITIFYLVAVGSSHFKQKIRMSYEDIDKKVEEQTAELKREKEYTRNLLKSSLDGIIAVDKDGHIKEVNERTCELFESDREEMIKKRVIDFYAPGEGTRIMNKLRKSANGSIENFDTFILSKKGEKIPILLSAAFLYDRSLNLKEELAKGKRFPTVGYFRDNRAEQAVDNIAEQITSATDEKTLLDKIVKIVAQTLKAETCSILTYYESTGRFKVTTSFGTPESLKAGECFESYDENESMIANISTSKQSLNIQNIDLKRRNPKNKNIKWEYAQNFAEHSHFGDFKHFLGTPLVVKGEVYGVIRVLNKYSRDNELDKKGFTDNDQKLLERISTHISSLIEKVRDTERFEAISKVGRELNEMLDVPLDKLLKIIAKGVVKGMRFKACYLRLIEDRDNLKIKACYGLVGDYKEKEKYSLKIGKGISGEVVKTGNYRAIGDLREEKKFEFKEILEEENLRSMLSIPLKYQNRVIGVINCYTRRAHKFTDQEIQIMSTFATYASTAIQNKKRIDELMALTEIGSELVKPIKIEELFDIILEKAKELSRADLLCIKTYDPRSGDMKTVRALNCGWYENHCASIVNTREGLGAKIDILGEVINEGNSRIIPNYDEIREKLKEVPDWELFKDVKSSALVPIKIDKKVFGIIFLESFRYNFFTEDDLLVLEAFSSQAAIALKNANFFNKFQRVTETFPKISELDSDIYRVLDNIAEIAADVLETDVLVLYRYDEKKKEIIWPPIFKGDIKYSEYMMTEVGEFDAPLLLINRGKNHYTDNSRKDNIMVPPEKRLEKRIPEGFVVREEIDSSAGILLKVGKEIVGIMFINYRTPHKFDEDERKIIENYASYIAIAIQNVRHFREKEVADAMQTLGQLAAAIAHKMKNDIATINLYTGGLIDKTSTETPHYVSLSRIKEKLSKMTDDIDFLLNASKLKIPDKEYIYMENLINEIEKEISSDLKVKGIKLEKKVAANIPEINVDPAQIKMVLSNLAYNSIDTMPNGGKIMVSISKLKDAVILDWKDTGTGILPEDADKVFRPFWTTKGKGFGLGLFLSKAIVENHGGSISLDSKYKKGAKFIIKFPIEA